MQPVSAIVVFIIIWWVVIFCVLPVGLSTTYEEADDDEGFRLAGAPKNLNIKRKLWITTGISFVIWLIILAVIMSGVVDLRAIALQE